MSLIVFLMAGALLMGALVYGVNKGNVPADTQTVIYTVQNGDTVWSVVGRFDTRDDLNKARDWVIEQNHLTGELHPGERIKVPVGR
ncbi:LysM peptidoglycan-binding domain-containing protein [Alicyclobacillus fastidiosus]|uniref:LysM peptidoglycan-binding domain-containing protein n=1 Tax=Alicyclobacillus fastidiosus TaxID=392011 RepID=A0ABY6ZKS0_9BACL|nr:LysM peptidoglycan-binding domain-containing protein [Alicyclobacillus fastidiosus]WAH43534.1 LysM peptidoglycan-binding domain-containing protein [Alicyclobacillus fastidiosus]